MRAWPLVGREAERRRLEAAATDGRVRGAIIVGEPGVGKTRLAAELVESLTAAGRSVHWIVGSATMRSIPYAALAHLFTIPTSGTAAQPILVARLLEALAGRATPAGAPVLVIDDATDLDDHSAALVELACRQATASVVMTARSSAEAAHPFIGLWKDGIIERVELKALDHGQTRRFVEAILEGPVESLTLSELWRRSGGNPLYLRELILGGLESGAFTRDNGLWRSSVAPPPSARLTEIIAERMGRLDGVRQRAVEILAVAGRIDLAVVEHVTDTAVIEALEEARLVTAERGGNRAWIRLAHPIYAEVVLARIPATRVRRLMAELADGLEATGARRQEDMLRLALWRLDSGGRAERDVLLQAAADALARFDAPLAERLARAAVGDEADAASLLLLGRALMGRQRIDEARDVLDRAAAVASIDDQVAPIALARADLLYFRAGRPEEATRVLVDAIQLVEESAWIDELRALLVLFQAGAGELHGVAEAGRRIAERPDARPRTVVHTLVFSSIANVMLGRFEEAEHQIGLGLDLVPKVRTELPLSGEMLAINGVMAHAYAGRLEKALQLGSDGRRHALEVGALEVVSMWSMNLAECQLLSGGIEQALHTMLGALAAARTSDPFGVRGIDAAVASICASWLGQHDLARSLHGEIVDNGLATDVRSKIWLDRSSAWLRLGEDGASAIGERFVDQAERAIADTHLVWATWQLHDAVRIGHPSRARPLLSALSERIEGEMVATMAHHAVALESADGLSLERVASAFERMGARLFAAEAVAQAQQAYLRAGRPRLARVAGARASLLASGCPAVQTPALRFAAPVPLTVRELEIARLAADGLSSRDVSDRLGIAVRTVDNHLGTIYAKLGVHGRAELVGVIGLARPE